MTFENKYKIINLLTNLSTSCQICEFFEICKKRCKILAIRLVDKKIIIMFFLYYENSKKLTTLSIFQNLKKSVQFCDKFGNKLINMYIFFTNFDKLTNWQKYLDRLVNLSRYFLAVQKNNHMQQSIRNFLQNSPEFYQKLEFLGKF